MLAEGNEKGYPLRSESSIQNELILHVHLHSALCKLIVASFACLTGDEAGSTNREDGMDGHLRA